MINAFRTLCAAVVAVLFLSFTGSSATAQTWYQYNPACMLTTEGCSDWTTVYAGVTLPEYPNCELVLAYEKRECPDPSNPYHPIEEIIVREIYWPNPADPNDPNDPCFGINDAYLSTLANQKKDFLYELFQDVLEVRFRNKFELDYERDSVEAVISPNNQIQVGQYTSVLCGGGKKTYRVINGLCMAAVTKPDVPFTPIFGGTEKKENGASIAGDPPQSQTNYMRVRYIPCDPPSEPICCIQRLEFCRNTSTWETDMQRTATIIGEPTACSLSVVSPSFIGEGETSTGCRDYCLDYHQTGTQGPGGDPDLSGPIDRGIFREREETGSASVGGPSRVIDPRTNRE